MQNDISTHAFQLLKEEKRVLGERGRWIRGLARPAGADIWAGLERGGGPGGAGLVRVPVEEWGRGLWGAGGTRLAKARAGANSGVHREAALDFFRAVTDGRFFASGKNGSKESVHVLNFFRRLPASLGAARPRDDYFREAARLAHVLSRRGVDLFDPSVAEAIHVQAYVKALELELARIPKWDQAIRLSLKPAHKGGAVDPVSHLLRAMLSGLSPARRDRVGRAFREGTLATGLIALGEAAHGDRQLAGPDVYRAPKEMLALRGIPLPTSLRTNPVYLLLELGLTLGRLRNP